MKRTHALNQNYLFRRLYRTGRSAVSPHLVVYCRPNRQEYNRLGITATKKLGNAVLRNRARRVVREAYRLLEDQLHTGFDMVVVVRTRATQAPMRDVRTSLAGALRRLQIL